MMLLVRKSLRQHALSTAVTAAAVALACGLVMSVVVVKQQAADAFTGGPVGFDAVLGARGSQLQLVLNTVFHLETSPGNLPWSLYQSMKADGRVKLAIPYAVGDNYRGFRIVGTSTEMFTHFEYQQGKKFAPLPGGRIFDAARREAVIGSVVAQRTGMAVGSTFNPYHGLDYDPDKRHEETYVVTGVLEATNSPSDRVVWIPIDGIFRMTGHVLRGTGKEFEAKAGEAIDDAHKEVSAVMLKFRNPNAGFQLNQTINRQGAVATLAWPIGTVMADLFEKMGWIVSILGLVAGLVVVVAAFSILASIYNAMNERRREFAILRALGARKSTVFSAIVLEAAAIAAIGSLLAFVVTAATVSAAAAIVRQQTGVVMSVFEPNPIYWQAPIGMIVVGALAGVIPAWKAYRTDVASNLMAQS